MHNVKIIGADQATDSGAPVASLVVVTGPAKLYSVMIFNTGPSQYYMVFDAAALPADGTVPKVPPIKVLTDSQGSIDFGDGRQFNAGIVVCNSSGATSKAIGAADSFLSVTYRKTS